MNRERLIEDFILNLRNDIWSKDYLTFEDEKEWRYYINFIIDECIKESKENDKK